MWKRKKKKKSPGVHLNDKLSEGKNLFLITAYFKIVFQVTGEFFSAVYLTCYCHFVALNPKLFHLKPSMRKKFYVRALLNRKVHFTISIREILTDVLISKS